MTDRARAVRREALALDDERAALAAVLLARLDDRFNDPSAVHQMWTREIERSARRELSDEGIDWPGLRGRVLDGIAARSRRFDA
jgi:hypothetical protein